MTAVRAAGLEELSHAAVESGRPFLGVCVGMQLLYEASDESPGVPGLGLLPGTVRLLPDDVKRPQMQWNVVRPRRPSKLLDGLPEPAWMYFVHSYVAPDGGDVVATCDYGGEVPALVERGNVAATQFHPEKSGANGLHLLRNWVDQL
jgi:glutamine amidotransferase